MVPYLGDFSEDETVYMPFNTFDSNDPSASVTITNLADADIKVHKDGNTSEIVTDGATVAIDFDGITGNHLFTIDTSVHADYATGSDYLVRMEGTTVDGATVNAWVGHFSIENRHSAGALRPATAGRTLVVDAAGLADANMVKSGPTGSGTAQTANDNGADINAILTDTAEIGAAGAGLTAINLPNQTMDIVGDITGNLSGSVGSVTGAVGSVTADVTIDATSVDLVWDEILTGATHNIATSAGRRLRSLADGAYSGGRIYIDTINGSGTAEDFEDGIDSSPVDSIADANTIAASLGLTTFHVAAGSTITLAAAQSGQTFQGENWTLALNGQDISGSVFEGATVSGVAAGTGTRQIFSHCLMNACSHIKGTHILESSIAATQTVVEAGDFFLDRCHSGIAGTATWVWDFGAAIGNTNLNVRNYSGGIQIESMGDTGTDTASIEGRGQIIEGTCTGGTVAVRGPFTTSGITNLTLSDDARLDMPQINAQCDTALSDYDGPTNTEMLASFTTTDAAIAVVDGNVDAILVDTGTTLPATLAALNDISVADILTTQMTESYAANGVGPTLAQSQFAMHQMLMQFGISGTSLTVRKLDDSTTAFVVTLDDATNPTDAKRV